MRKTWPDAKSQEGAFHSLANAKKCADSNAGYKVFNESGNAVYPTAGVSSVPKSMDAIAKEVIRGDWGNGAERKQRLAAAGYDYEPVQKRVNEILAGTSTLSKTVDEIAKEVIQGKWGNGAERKQRLTAAGYNYSVVQNRVNEMLK